VVRLPRTARDVLRQLSASAANVQRGVRLAGAAPALTIAERQHIERVLGAERVALCAGRSVSVTSGPARNGFHWQLAFALLGYAALGRIATSPHRSQAPPPRLMHSIDFTSAALLTLASRGPSSSPFFQFLSTLPGAPYRPALPETLITALSAVRAQNVSVAGAALPCRAAVAIVGDPRSKRPGHASLHHAMRNASDALLALLGAERPVTSPTRVEAARAARGPDERCGSRANLRAREIESLRDRRVRVDTPRKRRLRAGSSQAA
jgi:hypothetical protein